MPYQLKTRHTIGVNPAILCSLMSETGPDGFIKSPSDYSFPDQKRKQKMISGIKKNVVNLI
jgi:hypothetical protein